LPVKLSRIISMIPRIDFGVHIEAPFPSDRPLTMRHFPIFLSVALTSTVRRDTPALVEPERVKPDLTD
jgi:hypothetical protein